MRRARQGCFSLRSKRPSARRHRVGATLGRRSRVREPHHSGVGNSCLARPAPLRDRVRRAVRRHARRTLYGAPLNRPPAAAWTLRTVCTINLACRAARRWRCRWPPDSSAGQTRSRFFQGRCQFKRGRFLARATSRDEEQVKVNSRLDEHGNAQATKQAFVEGK